MDIKYFDNIIEKLSQYEDIELISSLYWDTVYDNIYLTHELLKIKKFKLFNKINPIFFHEEIICLDLLNYEQPCYEYIPDKFLQSPSFWIHLLEQNYTYASKIPESFLKNNANFCLWVCEKFSEYPMLHYFPSNMKNDFDLAYFAVNMNPENFKSLHKELRDNSYIYEIIYKNQKIKSSDYFKLTGQNIQSNYKFAKKSIIDNASSFVFVDNQLKNNSAFFLEMLNYSDNILKFASKEIKNNELYVLASIEKNPLSIEFANNRLKGSIDFLLSAYEYIDQYPNFIEFAKLLDSEVFNNVCFVEKYFNLICKNSAYYLLEKDITNNYDLIQKFVFYDINAFSSVSDLLKKDITFIQECYTYHNSKNILQQFDIESYQSSIFKMLPESTLNDIFFIQQLYQEFKPIFKEIVFPIIQKRKTVLTQLLSNEIDIEQGINHLLDKFELKNKLENQFQHSVKHKNKKI